MLHFPKFNLIKINMIYINIRVLSFIFYIDQIILDYIEMKLF